MVFREQFALNLEQVFGVAEVGAQFVGDGLLGFHRAGEGAHPRLQDRIVAIDLVQRHRAVVGVHGGLDGVPRV